MAQTTISGASSALNASLDSNGGSIPTTFNADGATGVGGDGSTTTSSTVAPKTPTTYASSAANYDTSNARINPLHFFVNYTYRVSLYAVPVATANLVANGSITPGQESQIISNGQLIASDAGSNISSKSQFFQKDLGIENLNFSSIVGAGSRARGTNVLQLTFDIIEPYTSVFIPNLVLCSKTVVPDSNDWNTMCFVMMIQFLGYDDNGTPTIISDLTKYIPFTIGTVNCKINHKGSIYSVIGIPLSGTALTPIHNDIQFHCEVGGTTVNDVFNSQSTDTKGIVQVLNDAENAVLASNINNNSMGLKTYADQYVIVFDPVISSATVADIPNFKNLSFVMSNPQGPVGNSGLDVTKNTFKAMAGTRITDLINNVVANSSYMRNQVGQATGCINWWKITATVQLLNYDPLTKRYARQVTYNVKPFPIYGRDNIMFSSQAPTAVSKVYNYIYTGLNQDIEHLDIEYKALFIRTYNASSYSNAFQANDGISSNLSQNVGPVSGPTVQSDTRTFKTGTQPIYGNAQFQNTGATNSSPQSSAVNDLLAQVLDTENDMLRLDATIVGDPDLIQQDEILYGTNPTVGTSPNYSTGEIYFVFNFISPTNDYDDSTGLFGSGTVVPFTGLYYIMQIDNIFNKGKFTQKLVTNRVPWQVEAGQATTTSPTPWSPPAP